MTEEARRWRSAAVVVGLTGLVAASFVSCEDNPDNRAVCVDPTEQVRVDDAQCDDSADDYDGHSTGHYWYYLRSGSTAPGVGDSYRPGAGTYDSSSLSGSVERGGVDANGGTIKRGGFGGFHFSGS
ncbi:hypothetical protein [Nocardioides sp. WS12]|uniref:hypothetical protein n=1 Tax=Nocardioides sp. WS12 TaxID=2486272 RepID=UPI0015FC6644|nr:hypothetical protein [Nocardioides sp. WS12]